MRLVILKFLIMASIQWILTNTVSTLFYSGFFSIACHSCLLPLCLSLSNLLAAGCGYEHFWTWTKQLHFSHFFFFTSDRKTAASLYIPAPWRKCSSSALFHLKHSKKNRNGRFNFKCYSKSYFASQWTMGALDSLVSQQLFWVSG